MTKHINHFFFFIFMLLTTNKIFAETNVMKLDSLWAFTRKLETVWGGQIHEASSIIKQPLVDVNPPAGNRYTTAPFLLADGLEISDMDIRLSPEGHKEIKLIAFVVSNMCVSPEELKEAFSDVKIAAIPRSKSSHAVISYQTTPNEKGVAFAFSFPANNPHCLKRVIVSKYE